MQIFDVMMLENFTKCEGEGVMSASTWVGAMEALVFP